MTIRDSGLRAIICDIARATVAPDRLVVIPAGTVKSTKSEDLLDAQGAAEIIAAFRAHGVDLPIDYEHQTLGGEYAAPDGRALAAGWIKNLAFENGVGLVAEVTWTEKGAAAIAAREYRYASPVYFRRKDDGRIVRLHSVALTNKPAIVGFPVIAQSESSMLSDYLPEQLRYWLNLPTTATLEDLMTELEKLIAQLREMAGAPATADQTAVVTALKERIALAKRADALTPAVCKALGLKEDADDAAIVAAINSAKKPAEPNPAQYVPIDEHKRTVDRLTALETELKANKADAFIAGGVKSGKIIETTKGMWKRLFDADEVQACKDLDTAPVISPPEGRVVHKDAGGKTPAGTDRASVIRRACSEYDGLPENHRIAGKESFVIGSLADANLAPKLTDEEKKLIA